MSAWGTQDKVAIFLKEGEGGVEGMDRRGMEGRGWTGGDGGEGLKGRG